MTPNPPQPVGEDGEEWSIRAGPNVYGGAGSAHGPETDAIVVVPKSKLIAAERRAEELERALRGLLDCFPVVEQAKMFRISSAVGLARSAVEGDGGGALSDDDPVRERYRALLSDGRITPNTARALDSIPIETRDKLLDAFEWLSDQLRRVGV